MPGGDYGRGGAQDPERVRQANSDAIAAWARGRREAELAAGQPAALSFKLLPVAPSLGDAAVDLLRRLVANRHAVPPHTAEAARWIEETRALWAEAEAFLADLDRPANESRTTTPRDASDLGEIYFCDGCGRQLPCRHCYPPAPEIAPDDAAIERAALNLWSADITFYAFRYALGRQSYAVSDVAAYLVRVREQLPARVRRLICSEIEEAIKRGRAGADMDMSHWRAVAAALNTPEDTDG